VTEDPGTELGERGQVQLVLCLRRAAQQGIEPDMIFGEEGMAGGIACVST
jgi:hypothetical protein